MYRFLLIFNILLLLASVVSISLCVMVSGYFWFMIAFLIFLSMLIKYVADDVTKEFEYTIYKSNFVIKKVTMGNGTKILAQINLKQMNSLAKTDLSVVNFNRKNNIIFATYDFENSFELKYMDKKQEKSIFFTPDKFMVSKIYENYEKILKGKLL